MRMTVKLLEQAVKGSSRINTTIDMQSTKVATLVQVEELRGKKTAYCRCWKSKKFPLCDGSHSKHNQEAGDNVGPLIIQKST